MRPPGVIHPLKYSPWVVGIHLPQTVMSVFPLSEYTHPELPSNCSFGPLVGAWPEVYSGFYPLVVTTLALFR